MTTANQILIVDDDPDILNFLIEILQDEIGVSFAPNGVKALEFSKTQGPDLILLDVDMPGMDGFEVCRQLQNDPATRHIPVIFLTAKGEDKDIAEGLELGAVDYITKPFDSKIVIAKVRNQLAQITALRAENSQRSIPEQERRKPESGSVGSGSNTGRGGLPSMAMILIILLLLGGGYLGMSFYTTPDQPSGSTPDTGINSATNTAPGVAPKNPASDTHIWPFNSKCEQSPVASWWGTTTHFSMVDYVNKKHGGNWDPYTDKWVNQFNKMQDIYDRNGSASVSDGTVLTGETLLAHIEKLKKRISVIRCLAEEARTVKP